MMVSPNYYADSIRNLSLKELIKERDEMNEYLIDLEKLVLSEDEDLEEHLVDPSPEVRYQMQLLYLSELYKLFVDKFQEEVIYGHYD